MPSSLSQTKSRSARRALLFFGLIAIAALAFPTLKWATHVPSAGPSVAFADEKAQPTDAGKAAAGADRRDKPGTATKGRDAAVEVEYLPRPSRVEEQILAALEKPIDVEFLDLALEDCLNFLHETANVPIWLDKQTLTDEGVALDQPITLKLKGARLESVLHLLLKPVQLAFLPEDDVMVITTATKAGEILITRTYPVHDLFQGRVEAEPAGPAQKPGEPAQKTEKATASNIRGGGFFGIEIAQGFGGGGANAGAGKDGGAADAKPASPPPPKRYDDLVDAITNTIDPDSWEDVSGPGTYTYVKETGCLVIRQTWDVHRKILQLLRDLREAKHLAAKH
jgi:general secretion pathway protein D